METDQPSYLKSKEIYHGVYQIIIRDFVHSYLIIGGCNAMLIDTGWGIGDLKSLVESITSLPLIVINTHGHIDHVYGNYQFDNIYIRDEDLPMMQRDFLPQKRADILKHYDKSLLPPGMTEEDWINAKLNQISSLNKISNFDLGGRIIDVIEMPGHTLGSICLLDRNERLLFTGDSVFEGPNMLQFNLSAKLNVYLKSLENIISKTDLFDAVLPSHGDIPVRPEFLAILKSGVEKIISGEVEGVKHTVYNRDCFVCKFDNFKVLYRSDSF